MQERGCRRWRLPPAGCRDNKDLPPRQPRACTCTPARAHASAQAQEAAAAARGGIAGRYLGMWLHISARWRHWEGAIGAACLTFHRSTAECDRVPKLWRAPPRAARAAPCAQEERDRDLGRAPRPRVIHRAHRPRMSCHHAAHPPGASDPAKMSSTTCAAVGRGRQGRRDGVS